MHPTKIIPTTLIVLFSTVSFHFVSAIQCYRCIPKTSPVTANQTVESCYLFDSSAKFRVDCPLSTFCMKRNYTMDFLDGRTAVVTERGCAPQSLSYRIHKKGKWEVINDIDKEAYKDGCVLENQGDGRPTQYCYCSSRLCNSTPSLNANEQPLLVILLSVLFYLFLLC